MTFNIATADQSFAATGNFHKKYDPHLPPHRQSRTASLRLALRAASLGDGARTSATNSARSEFSESLK